MLKLGHTLVQLNLNKKESLKSKSLIDVGTHAKLLLESIAYDEKVKSFQSLCLKKLCRSYYLAPTKFAFQQEDHRICAVRRSSEKKSIHGKKWYLKPYTQIGQGVWK